MHQYNGVKLTVTIVLLLCSINGSICLQLQVETLSTVEFRHNPLQLGLCGRREQRGGHKDETTEYKVEDKVVCRFVMGHTGACIVLFPTAFQLLKPQIKENKINHLSRQVINEAEWHT